MKRRLFLQSLVTIPAIAALPGLSELFIETPATGVSTAPINLAAYATPITSSFAKALWPGVNAWYGKAYENWGEEWKFN